jgi:hypothetical protein
MFQQIRRARNSSSLDLKLSQSDNFTADLAVSFEITISESCQMDHMLSAVFQIYLIKTQILKMDYSIYLYKINKSTANGT